MHTLTFRGVVFLRLHLIVVWAVLLSVNVAVGQLL